MLNKNDGVGRLRKLVDQRDTLFALMTRVSNTPFCISTTMTTRFSDIPFSVRLSNTGAYHKPDARKWESARK
jgi:hypothetical protein